MAPIYRRSSGKPHPAKATSGDQTSPTLAVSGQGLSPSTGGPSGIGKQWPKECAKGLSSDLPAFSMHLPGDPLPMPKHARLAQASKPPTVPTGVISEAARIADAERLDELFVSFKKS
jgi:hypothetical protein